MLANKILALAAAVSGLACATPQTINVVTVPADAAISVDDEFVGHSPAAFTMKDVDDFETLRIAAERAGYETEVKTVSKRPGGLFPSKVYLQLDGARVRSVPAEAAGPSQQTRAFAPSSYYEVKCHLDEVGSSREEAPPR